MCDYSDIVGDIRNARRLQVYPAPEHFRRANESVWMRPYDLAEYETYRNADLNSALTGAVRETEAVGNAR